MEIQIQGQDRFLFIQSVLIAKNPSNTKNVYMLHCYSCRSTVSRIKGNIIQIRAGEIPLPRDVFAIQECPKCHKSYIITAFGKNDGPIKLTLVYDPYFLPNVFNCVICTQSLGEYTPDTFTQYPTRKNYPLPYPFICNRTSCGRSYLLEDVVSSTMNL